VQRCPQEIDLVGLLSQAAYIGTLRLAGVGLFQRQGHHLVEPFDSGADIGERPCAS
jgi:hypothetical protein